MERFLSSNKINVKTHTRSGMGYDYNETSFYCPKCNKLIASHNGVQFVSGKFGQNYCDNCGCQLDWEDFKETDYA